MNRMAVEAREELWSWGESTEHTAGSTARSTAREPGRQAREALALALALAEIPVSQGRPGLRLS